MPRRASARSRRCTNSSTRKGRETENGVDTAPLVTVTTSVIGEAVLFGAYVAVITPPPLPDDGVIVSIAGVPVADQPQDSGVVEKLQLIEVCSGLIRGLLDGVMAVQGGNSGLIVKARTTLAVALLESLTVNCGL